MRLHENIRLRLVVKITALAVAFMGTGLVDAPPSNATGLCGATADDLFGTFVAHRTPPAYSPDHADDQPLIITFSAPNQVSSDNKAIRNGSVYATMAGSGTFSAQPLSWTEQGSVTIGDMSGSYEMTFKASQVDCAGGSQVSGFTGTFTSPHWAASDTESYVRQQ